MGWHGYEKGRPTQLLGGSLRLHKLVNSLYFHRDGDVEIYRPCFPQQIY